MKSLCHKKEGWQLLRMFWEIFYKTFGVFLFCFIALKFLGSLEANYFIEKEYVRFTEAIQRDILFLKEEGDEIARQENVIESVVAEDKEALLEITKNEIEQRDIGLMGIANRNGTMLSRTLSPGKVGDNVFLTVPAGRIVAQDKSIESFELTGFSDQFFMTTARPIHVEGEMVGALFANRLLDNEYARAFRDQNLFEDTELIFYSKQFGVYGSTFTDESTDALVRSYFNENSEWIENGKTDSVINFSDDAYFLVKNIPLQSIEGSVGGAILFIPRHDLSPILFFLPVFLSIIALAFFTRKEYACFVQKGKQRKSYLLAFFILVSLVLLGTSSFIFTQSSKYEYLASVPYPLYNSTMHLRPEWGIYNIGFEQSVEIVVKTGDESINAVQATINFDPSMVSVREVDTSNSPCSFLIEKTIDSVTGTIKVSCILLDLPAEESALAIANIYYNPLQVGTINFTFDQQNTHVLANDGLGTSVLRMAQNGSYRIASFSATVQGSDGESSENEQQSFVVFSPSHPNQERWYNADAVDFVWVGNEGGTFQYVIDNEPKTIPVNGKKINTSHVRIPLSGDGIFYFHLQLASGGPVSHYRIRSDRTPPVITSFEISSAENRIFVGDVVRFLFDAEDVGSGMQQNYYIDFGNDLFLPIGKQLSIPFLNSGEYPITLRAYDGAENYSEKLVKINVISK